MAMWSGPGPVFEFESLVAARRWAYYAARSGFGLLLLIALGIVWSNLASDLSNGVSTESRAALARLGEQFYCAIAGVQITLILLVAPAATAGSICLDRARGTLTHLFVTDLSDLEIVLGKLAARLAPVLALIAAAAPILALAGLLGGVVPEAVVALEVTSVGLAILGCSLALAVSVRVAKAHEVLMAVYAALILWLLSVPYWYMINTGGRFIPPPDWYVKLNPYVLTFLPYEPTATIKLNSSDLVIYTLVMIATSALFVWYAKWSLRRELKPERTRAERLNQFFENARWRFYSWWPSPSLDGNPVLWREWHRNQPSRIAWRLWAIFWIASTLSASYGIYEILHDGLSMGSLGWTLPTNAFMVAFGMLFLSATAPTALSEERVRGSLDLLMSTPLSTRTIVLGKWWAVFRVVPVLAVIPALGALMFTAAAPVAMTMTPGMLAAFPNQYQVLTFSDRINAVAFPVAWIFANGALFTSVGLALATWIERPGRAIGASVAFYLFVLIGFPMLIGTLIMPAIIHSLSLSWGDRWIQALQMGLMSVSPFVGQIASFEWIAYPFRGSPQWLWVFQSLELLATFALAGLVLVFTILTFDSRLGRVSEQPAREAWIELHPIGSKQPWTPRRRPAAVLEIPKDA